ncbi:Ig-like domain-containing protein [Niallia sp. 01092]|uniref:Ig-like domain-containing protein n=1 Tax=unclassified Niallia TaxID=2837522 RepID=UPI003FD60AA7
MNKIFKVSLSLLFGLYLLSHSVSIAAAEDSTECGNILQGQNPSNKQINCLLTTTSLKAGIPPEVAKAIATQESDWKQFKDNGEASISADGGIGLMQITNQTNYDQERLKTDIVYNISTGIEILNSMYDRTDLPKISGANKQVLESWYFPIMAYNGTKPINSPIVQSTGNINSEAYQEKVLRQLYEHSFLSSHTLSPIPLIKEDFQYNPDTEDNIIFQTLNYNLQSELHESIYSLNKGDKVVTINDHVRLRKEANTSKSIHKLAKNATLVIDGTFVYDSDPNISNQFVWYPVKTSNGKYTGYISSAYITKKVDAPSVNKIDDNDKSITGKAPANVNVMIKKGATLLNSAVSDNNGQFTINIPHQKAGTKLEVMYTNYLHALSEKKKVTVVDKTAPSAPKLDKVKSTSKMVTGKAESSSHVILKVNNKKIGWGTTDKKGRFRFTIKPQKVNTKIYATATDAANNTSKASIIKVVK